MVKRKGFLTGFFSSYHNLRFIWDNLNTCPCYWSIFSWCLWLLLDATWNHPRSNLHISRKIISSSFYRMKCIYYTRRATRTLLPWSAASIEYLCQKLNNSATSKSLYFAASSQGRFRYWKRRRRRDQLSSSEIQDCQLMLEPFLPATRKDLGICSLNVGDRTHIELDLL